LQHLHPETELAEKGGFLTKASINTHVSKLLHYKAGLLQMIALFYTFIFKKPAAMGRNLQNNTFSLNEGSV